MPFPLVKMIVSIDRYRNQKENNSDTFLRLNWKQLSKIPEVKPAVKKYIINRVKLAVQVPADEWDVAIFMPVARFQKASEKQVYSDSKRMIA